MNDNTYLLLVGTITKAKYFYQYLVEDWYINLDQTRKDGKRIIQIFDTETIHYRAKILSIVENRC